MAAPEPTSQNIMVTCLATDPPLTESPDFVVPEQLPMLAVKPTKPHLTIERLHAISTLAHDLDPRDGSPPSPAQDYMETYRKAEADAKRILKTFRICNTRKHFIEKYLDSLLEMQGKVVKEMFGRRKKSITLNIENACRFHIASHIENQLIPAVKKLQQEAIEVGGEYPQPTDQLVLNMRDAINKQRELLALSPPPKKKQKTSK